jgi:Bacterial Ig-like domain (group 3)
MNWQSLKRIGIWSVALVILALSAPIAFAQGPLTPTAMTVGAPATAQLGQSVTLQARLADDAGHPIANGLIDFEIPTTFLNVSGNAVIAQTTTNKDGVAMAEYKPTMSGNLTITAEFKGDQTLAPSTANATLPVNVTPAEAQLYVQQAGVPIPGLNEPMVVTQVMLSDQPPSGIISVLNSLWPTMSVWPLLLVLLIVWGLYGYAVTRIFRVARAQVGSDDKPRRTDVSAPRFSFDQSGVDQFKPDKER